MASSPGPTRLLEQLCAERRARAHGRRRILDLEADRIGRRAVHDDRTNGRSPSCSRVDDDVDIALAEERRHPWSGAGRVARSPASPAARRAPRASASSAANSTNSTPSTPIAVRHAPARRSRCRARSRHLVHEIDQRAAAVDRDRLRRAAAELVVEDLERQRPVIAGRRDRPHEIDDRQVAFARHVAEVPAPVEQVHVDQRRVGKLDDEDLVAGDRADRVDVDLARQRVEAVEDQADIRVVGAAHDLPGVAVVVDVPAPGERLVADAQAALGRPLAEFAKIGRGAVDAAERQRARRWSRPASDRCRAPA